ncbi:MAG: hypothetical protein ABSH46_18990 [Bryobacteraceae bacterium]|jgi:hypothetical protein
MKLAGFLLLVAGWAIVLAAAALLKTVLLETAFVLAGVGTELVGLVLVIRSHLMVRAARG